MKWVIPGKTFLLGEYLALFGGPAIVLTTQPCFEVSLSDSLDTHSLHPESPAGKYWQSCDLNRGLEVSDPYHGIGGLGASSAEFLGAYLACKYLKNERPTLDECIDAFEKTVFDQEKKIKPSGYDLIAQSYSHCMYIDKSRNALATYPWCYSDIDFILFHTGKKLKTHSHLDKLDLPSSKLNQLAEIVGGGLFAFEREEASYLVEAVERYAKALDSLGLVALHTQQILANFSAEKGVLALKGCGAMGSDVVAMIVDKQEVHQIKHQVTQKGFKILATSQDLCEQPTYT